MLSFRSVTAGYGKRVVLHEVTLHFDEGLHVVLASNGAGKTTLFRVGAGMLPPIRGTVEICGIDPYVDPTVKSKVGYLSQGGGLSPRLTVKENLVFWSKVQGLSKSLADKRLQSVVSSLELSDILNERVGLLSGGQYQRVALAQTLLHNPKVMLMDEPTTGLDPTAARTLRGLLRTLSEGRVIVYSTHNMHEAVELASDVTFLAQGRCLVRGSMDEIRKAATDGSRRIGLRVKQDPRPIFQELGVRTKQEGAYWVLDLEAGSSLDPMIGALLRANMEILEIRELNNVLEDLFIQLERGGKEGGS
ncbi:MAG: ABC transporter ATP-binding protein [Alicyclobacillus sp.]|nr:ABC transporter ATP-binding protein [Alicyclobacillus sp.]